MKPNELSEKHGLGEVYRVYAQIKLIKDIKSFLHISHVVEYPFDPIAYDFPLNWVQSYAANVSADLLFTWRAFPEIIDVMVDEFRGKYLMFIATNKFNFGVLFQKLYWGSPEVYHSISSLKNVCLRKKLYVKKTGYYDSPLWPDAPLPFNWHISRNDDDVRDSVSKREDCCFQYFRAHHVYCIALKNIL